jgi:MOSC domain-containing protein YiiM
MASLLGIAVRPPGLRQMQEVQRSQITPAEGLIGDKRSRPGRRQVTLMSLAVWRQVCRELGDELPWTTRRANLLVDDLPLFDTSGSRVRIGDVVLEITGETDPCAKMEAARQGLLDALRPQWRGGVTCRVLQGGILELGQAVELEPGAGPEV